MRRYIVYGPPEERALAGVMLILDQLSDQSQEVGQMKEVGSYEAKTHLAELLAAAEEGETLIITRRGKPIAKITPYRPPTRTVEHIAHELARLRAGRKSASAH